jgi:hypothetical protein
MRWDRLFDDLDAQFDAARRADLDGEVADRIRREVALVHMVDRLAAAVGRTVQLVLPGDASLGGSIARVGDGWALIETAGGVVLVRLAAVMSIAGLPVEAVGLGPIESTLGVGHVLRGIARDRSPVSIGLVDGSRLEGTVDRVGADHIDVAIHPIDEPRREAVVAAVRTVGFDALATVRPD